MTPLTVITDPMCKLKGNVNDLLLSTLWSEEVWANFQPFSRDPSLHLSLVMSQQYYDATDDDGDINTNIM